MELFRALASLLEPPTAAHRAVAGAAGLPPPPPPDRHTEVLVFQAYPYASVYLGGEGMLGGEARDRIAGFWRALGAEPPSEPDHLGCLLAALARLADEEEAAAPDERRASAARAARRTLFWDHVASWMPPYLSLLRRVGGGFYAAWADLAEAALAAEAAELGPPVRLAQHLRLSEPTGDRDQRGREDPAGAGADATIAGERAGLDGCVALLLAPVRAGLAIARDDLVRAAGELGLGCRAGERRHALRSLLEQDAAAVLGWLAAEARRQAGAALASPLRPAAEWWHARASHTAGWLDRAAEAAAAAIDAGTGRAATDGGAAAR